MSLSTTFTRAGALLSLALPLAILQACGGSVAAIVAAEDAGVDADASAHPGHDASVGNEDDDGGAPVRDSGGPRKDAATDGEADAHADDGGPVLGGDPGPIGDTGVCTLVPGPHPIQNFSVSNVVVSGDATQTITVPDGFVVSGTIAAPIADDHPLAKSWFMSSLLLFNPATGALYRWSDGASHYSLTVPAGRYYAEYSVRYELRDNGPTGVTNDIVLRGVDILDVCGDAVHDVTLRSLPALSPAKIAATGIDRLHLSGGFGNDVGLTSGDGTFIWQGSAGDGTSAAGTISTLLPLNETLSVLMNGQILPDVVAASTMTVTLPTQVNVTGSLTMQSGAKGVVQCDVPTQNPLNARAWPGDSERFASARRCDL